MTSKVKKQKSTLKRREPKGNKGRRTKQQIQEAIIDLVSVDGLGLNEIKLDRICKKAGVTIGAFYFHFENKDAAIQETAIDSLNEFKKELLSLPHEADLYSELRKIILVYIGSLVRRPKATQLLYAVIRNSPEVHKVYEDMHFEIADRMQRLISHTRAVAGRNEAESELIVEFLMAGIESFIENVFMWGNERTSRLGKDPELLAHKLAAMWVNIATTSLAHQEN